MDEKLYRKLFQETPSQRQRRHNGIIGPRIFYRKCRRCGGTGRRLDASDSKEDAVCHPCGGSGTVSYRRG